MKSFFFFVFLFVSAMLLSGCLMGRPTSGSGITVGANASNNSNDTQTLVSQYKGSFTDSREEICAVDGKPVIRLYSTEGCPHCRWIKDTYDKVVGEYVASGKIVAYHWDMNTRDDILTSGVESMPNEEMQYFLKNNQDRYVPHFVFGCRYDRIGNKYESSGGLQAEEEELRGLIDKIISEAKTS